MDVYISVCILYIYLIYIHEIYILCLYLYLCLSSNLGSLSLNFSSCRPSLCLALLLLGPPDAHVGDVTRPSGSVHFSLFFLQFFRVDHFYCPVLMFASPLFCCSDLPLKLLHSVSVLNGRLSSSPIFALSFQSLCRFSISFWSHHFSHTSSPGHSPHLP